MKSTRWLRASKPKWVYKQNTIIKSFIGLGHRVFVSLFIFPWKPLSSRLISEARNQNQENKTNISLVRLAHFARLYSRRKTFSMALWNISHWHVCLALALLRPVVTVNAIASLLTICWLKIQKKKEKIKKNAECLTLGKRLNVSIKFNRHATLINIFIYFLFARRLLFAAINAFEALNAFKSFYVWSKVILVQFLESKTVNGKFMRI